MKKIIFNAWLIPSLFLFIMFSILPYFAWIIGDKEFQIFKAFDALRYHHVLSILSIPIIIDILKRV